MRKPKYPNLEAEMARRGITGTELARRLNLSRQAVNGKRFGDLNFSLNQALQTSKILDSTVEDLFTK